ncbi:galactose mutarotase-like domain-containing protein [Dipodascopsis uninucleata]
MVYTTEQFGKGIKHVITTPNGLVSASFIQRGCALVDFTIKKTPDDPSPKNINLKFDSTEEYYERQDNPFLGAFVGRVANRLKEGKFTLDGKEYELVKNNFGHCLHGGTTGFDKMKFDGPKVTEAASSTSSESLIFSYISPHMDQGFPGELAVIVKYWLEDFATGGALFMEYEAQLTGPDEVKSTIVNLTNHSSFNIADGPTIAGTTFSLGTKKYMEVTDTFVPTGKIADHPALSTENEKVLLGAEEPVIDHCFVYEHNEEYLNALDTRNMDLRKIAHLNNPDNKLHFRAESTEPAFQFYTGKFINVNNKYGKRAGFCLESSRYIDAINNDDWKNMVILPKGKTYGALTKYTLYY